MKLDFYKYQGAGNDFVIIDNREGFFPADDVLLINHLCDRRFGVGADGLMLLQNEEGVDFRMVYFNADGNESTMCGNGGRCIVHFAHKLGLIGEKTEFVAIDGKHHAEVAGDEVNLHMIDVDFLERLGEDYFLDTGSPHYVQYVEDIDRVDVFKEGRAIRNSARFVDQGTNVNFVEELQKNTIRIRTYERGVEDETLACGTGVTAAALVYGHEHGERHIQVKAEGGDLEVQFEEEGGRFSNVWLKGPAKFVYQGTIDC